MKQVHVAFVLCAAIGAPALGCGEDAPPPAAAAKAGEEKEKKSRKTKEAEPPKGPDLPPVVSAPIDFVEAQRWRDPFVSYAAEFALEAKKRVKSQREVVLDQYALDELKLAGLVTGIRPARAMLIDPSKTGHVVQEGQFVGKPEVVQGGTSGAEYEINWRVDRIRENDIVFVREDPANPDVPTATRVIPLRPEDVLAAR
ncbi:MAG TPA: pilus assembly protein PilP [Polyangiaceae bacterium]|nr:pilus assembly protein PilP [Polyangiaceae bacterium]